MSNELPQATELEDVPVSDEVAAYLSDWADHEGRSVEELSGLVVERAINDWRNKQGMEPLETVHEHDRAKEVLSE